MSNLKEEIDHAMRGYSDLLRKKVTGPKMTVEALSSNKGTIHVHPYEGPETVLQPGQSVSIFGYGLAVINDLACDGCHLTVG